MIDLEFADGSYTFALPLPQLLELQRATGWTDKDGNKRETGILTLYGRVMRGGYINTETGAAFGVPMEGGAHAGDCFETVRLALVGGGRGLVNGQEVEVGPNRARQLVETYLHPPAPIREAWDMARAILFACVEGYDGAGAQKKSPAGEEPKPRTGSARRKSSATAR